MYGTVSVALVDMQGTPRAASSRRWTGASSARCQSGGARALPGDAWMSRWHPSTFRHAEPCTWLSCCKGAQMH